MISSTNTKSRTNCLHPANVSPGRFFTPPYSSTVRLFVGLRHHRFRYSDNASSSPFRFHLRLRQIRRTSSDRTSVTTYQAGALLCTTLIKSTLQLPINLTIQV